jgi:hypothetical protein
MPYQNYGGYLPKEYLGVHGGAAPSAIMNALIQSPTGTKSGNPYDGFLQHALNVAYPGANFAFGPVDTKSTQSMSQTGDPFAGYGGPLRPNAPPPETHPGPAPPSTEHPPGTQTPPQPAQQMPRPAPAPSLTGNAAGFIQALGPEFSWVSQRSDLLGAFQQWAQTANFAQNPDDFKTWAWAMNLAPGTTPQQRQLSLAEIFSRYPGQEYLRGRGDLIAAWEVDPAGKNGGAEFGSYAKSKGWNAQTPAFAGYPYSPSGAPRPGGPLAPTPVGGTPGGPGGGVGGGVAPTPVAPSPTATPGDSDAQRNLQRALDAHFANQSQQALRAYRAAGSQYGLENTGAFGQGAQELLNNLAVQFGTQGAEALFQSHESELDRILQRYGIDTGAQTSRYGVDASSASAAAARALEHELGLGRLAGDEQGRFMNYDLGLRGLGADTYQTQIRIIPELLRLFQTSGPEQQGASLINAILGGLPGTFSWMR